MNKYGYFKYSDFSLGAKENATYSVNKDLQEGSSLTHLRVGVLPFNFASIEQNEYVTSQPKKLYRDTNEELGLLTKEISNENGVFADPIILTIDFPAYFSMTGITIASRNIIKSVTITAYQNGVEVAKGTFSATTKEYFFPLNIELANKVEISVSKIDKPYHFFGIYKIEYGRLRKFDETANIDVELTNNFSVLGDTLEYDTLDLTVVDPEKEDYLFQRKQPIDFIVDEKQKARFYVDSGTELDDHTVQVLAYDEIASLEDNFYGGMYEDYPFNSLVADILGETSIPYETKNTDDVLLSGYLPISTRRKALQTILQGSNIRCYKSEKLVFKPLESQTRDIILDETNILEKPQKNKKQGIKSFVLKKKNYSKGTEESELYHWYISTTENVRIEFDNPVYNIKAYEVIGVDEDDKEIVSETESQNVTFVDVGVNYCTVSNTSSNKIVIVGLNYVDSTVSYKKANPLTAINEVYEEKEIELTISSSPQKVCNFLYELYSRKNSINFSTFENLEIGGYYSILGEKLNIKKIQNALNGIYVVEAV